MPRANLAMMMQPELLSQEAAKVRTHNPYALKLLPSPSAVPTKSAKKHQLTPIGRCECGSWDCDAAPSSSAASRQASTIADECESPQATMAPPTSPCTYLQQQHAAAQSGAVAVPRPARQVLVNFKFGSRIFNSTFRVAPGDAVIVEWDGGATHIGLVAEVLPLDPSVSAAMQHLPLQRRARDGDMAAFQSMRYREMTAVTECQRVLDKAPTGPCPVSILDAEWLLDGSGVTLSLAFDGPPEQLDNVHVALRQRLGCEVWLLTTADLIGLAA